MPTRSLCLAFSLAVVSIPAAGQGVSTRIERYMRAREALGQFSGAVLVSRGDRVLYANGFGFADFEQRVPNRRNTRFAVASITKQFTALAIAQLRDAGTLSLDDKFCRFVDKCPEAWANITIDQLVHHSSGIPDYEQPLDLDSDRYAQYMMAADNSRRILDDARTKPLDFSPGTKFHYSNTGYLLLGKVIERASGASYATYLRDRILAPTRMTASGILPADTFVPDLATGYSAGDNGSMAQMAAGISYLHGNFVRSTPLSIMATDHADGGLISTVDDLHAWLRALAKNTLVSPTTTTEIFTPKLGYAFGWIIDRRFDQPDQFHTGVLPGFVSRIDRFPESDVDVVVASNVNVSRTGRISRDIAAIALGKPYDVPKARKLIDRDSSHEAPLVGKYVFPDGKFAEVSSGDHFLEAKTETFTAGLLRETATMFYAPFFEGDVTFTLDKSGRGASVNLHYNGEDHVARRVEP